MKNSLRNQTEIEELKHEKSSGFIGGVETNERTNMPIKDPDTMLSMTVLLLACLALAVLAHVFV